MDWVVIITVLAGIATILSMLYICMRFLYNKIWNERKITKNWRNDMIGTKLQSYLSKNEYKKNDENFLDIEEKGYYINIRGRKKLKDSYEDIDDLVKYFIEIYFFKKLSGKKRFFIIADSGMGKTTFSLFLIYMYIRKCTKNNMPYDIFIKNFDNNYEDEIKKIVEPENTILILDGLDENLEATKSKYEFIDNVDKLTEKFVIVIITCRSQFFSSDEEEKKDTIIANKPIPYIIFNILPFTDDDIIKYLDNKYGVGSKNYIKAKNIIDKCSMNEILSRPLILSFIDDILDISYFDNLNAYIVYKCIIDSWFNRECDILRVINDDKAEAISNLYFLSKGIAVFIYQEWKKSGNLYITSSQYEEFVQSHKNDTVNHFSFKERSLLTRKEDKIQFCHKSFLEFFLALDAANNPERGYEAEGYDMASEFLKDIYELSGKEECKKHLNIVDFYSPIIKKNDFNQIVCFVFDKLGIDFNKEELTNSSSYIDFSEIIKKYDNNVDDNNNYRNDVFFLWNIWCDSAIYMILDYHYSDNDIDTIMRQRILHFSLNTIFFKLFKDYVKISEFRELSKHLIFILQKYNKLNDILMGH